MLSNFLVFFVDDIHNATGHSCIRLRGANGLIQCKKNRSVGANRKAKSKRRRKEKRASAAIKAKTQRDVSLVGQQLLVQEENKLIDSSGPVFAVDCLRASVERPSVGEVIDVKTHELGKFEVVSVTTKEADTLFCSFRSASLEDPTTLGVACLRDLGALARKELPDNSRISQANSGKTSFKREGDILSYLPSVHLPKPSLLVRFNLVVLKYCCTPTVGASCLKFNSL